MNSWRARQWEVGVGRRLRALSALAGLKRCRTRARRSVRVDRDRNRRRRRICGWGVGSGEKGTSPTAFGREFTDNEKSVHESSLLGRAPLARLTAARTRCVAHTLVRYDGRCKRASGRACLLSLFSRLGPWHEFVPLAKTAPS